MVAFAMSHLQGRAEAWAFSLHMPDPHRFPTLDVFADQLKVVFLLPNSDIRHCSRYLSSTQGKSTVRNFVQEPPYLYTCITDEASSPEATRETVFMNGLNKGSACTELFRQEPKTFEHAVNIALSEDFSQTLARSKPFVSSDMNVSSTSQQYPQDE
ncbi:hypothetical protein Ae201684P_007753 [Aphanomyces euteiches]|nr:hypothetical protein Ae201684P_007753 [Aphanomyces euteiches]